MLLSRVREEKTVLFLFFFAVASIIKFGMKNETFAFVRQSFSYANLRLDHDDKEDQSFEQYPSGFES